MIAFLPRSVPAEALGLVFSSQAHCLRSRRSEVRILSGVPKQSTYRHAPTPLIPSDRLPFDFSVPLTSPEAS